MLCSLTAGVYLGSMVSDENSCGTGGSRYWLERDDGAVQLMLDSVREFVDELHPLALFDEQEDPGAPAAGSPRSPSRDVPCSRARCLPDCGRAPQMILLTDFVAPPRGVRAPSSTCSYRHCV
jgi:hypothetical protein